MVDLNAFASLRIGSDGIWYPTNSADEAVSYPTDGNALCFQVEDSSFWFKHRNACITTLVKAFPPLKVRPFLISGAETDLSASA